MYVSIIGGDIGSSSDEDVKIAEDLGRKLAERDHTIVCGGRGGVMKAACKGAKEQDGETIGILPSANRDEANQYVDHPIVTDLGMLRNSLVVLNGDVVIAIDGGYGTLSEICFATKYGKTVLGIGTWDLDSVESFNEVNSLLERLDEMD